MLNTLKKYAVTENGEPISTAHKKLIEALSSNIAKPDLQEFDDSIFRSMTDTQWELSKKRSKKRYAVKVNRPVASDTNQRKTTIDVIGDDAAFLIDSVAATINEKKYLIDFLVHPILHIKYDSKGNLLDVKKNPHKDYIPQSYIHVHVRDTLSSRAIKELEETLNNTLEEVYVANLDWKTMLTRLKEARDDLQQSKTEKSAAIRDEYCAFIDYLHDNNFTLLGYREYEFKNSKAQIKENLGLLRTDLNHTAMDEKLEGFPRSLQNPNKKLPPVSISKTRALASVHRHVPMDVIAVKKYNETGKVIGERLFIGLYTSVTYSRSVSDIPYLRAKVQKIVDKSGFRDSSHDQKALRNILERYPRDELIQTETNKLYNIGLKILRLQERQRTALFVREDPFGGYISCLVYVPRGRFGTSLRKQIINLLEEEFEGTCGNFYTSMDDSLFARGLFRINVKKNGPLRYNINAIEERLQDLSRSSAEKLSQELANRDYSPEEVTNYTLKYGDAFPAAYKNRYCADQALNDIIKMEKALETKALQLDLYTPETEGKNQIGLRIYNVEDPVVLSDILPILNNMGLRAIAELPYEIAPRNKERNHKKIWIHDFLLESPQDKPAINLLKVKDKFEEALVQIWDNALENDALNKLVLLAGLDWREIIILRTYVKYMKQARLQLAQSSVHNALTQYPNIASLLIDLFNATFDPAHQKDATKKKNALNKKIGAALESVDSLNEDRIIRALHELMNATLRTNFFQSDKNGAPKPCVSIKLNSGEIKGLPKPSPFREIFVYSPEVEAIHLRGDKIARGGLRWSDRHEDFRTEVLGLMKAQMVKNSVIVPMGSKGGFVVKTKTNSREEFRAKGIECYKIFINGMLDITDNLDGNKVIPPKDVVRLDGDDPYLVVAADKGTATFSDIANGLSQDHGFWLGDAFASGGSAGYDHKKMGITARGAWESVRLHFRQLGHDTQSQEFDVIGCGDMGGDVFGNGMLLSEHIRLIGAFNHLHIFCDPNPDTESSYKERKRLFDKVGGWDQYDESKLSKGGRIYSRHDKTLKLTPEIRERFDIEETEISPLQLIKAILKARADLLWFGGIGTYIKSKDETHSDVGDKANDALRINAKELRAKVIGEGANLAITQLGRIEFSKHGGRINTDFIDNSAGVDSSDHEVNIKILLSAVMNNSKHKMTLKSRNVLLEKMTEEVGAHVLRHNYQQAQAVSLADIQAKGNLRIQDEFMTDLEREEGLSRAIEFLPDSEEIEKRAQNNQGLTRPEISVLISYSKIAFTKDLLASDIPDDPEMQSWLMEYFPDILQKKYAKEIKSHRLNREIIATMMASSLVNRLGPTFIKSTMKQTGMNCADIAKAYIITREAFGLRKIWDQIEALDNQVPAQVQLNAMQEMVKLSSYAIVWLLTRFGQDLHLSKNIKDFSEHISTLSNNIDKLTSDNLKDAINARMHNNVRDGLPKDLAKHIAILPTLASALDIIHISLEHDTDLLETARIYFKLGQRFHLDWLRQQARFKESDNIWDGEATKGLIDQLYSCQAGITIRILTDCKKLGIKEQPVQCWIDKKEHIIEQLDPFFEKLHAAGTLDLPMLVIAEQRLRNLYGG